MIQKYLNLWYSLSLDLFGGEVSTNAANFFAAGLKGRYKEETLPGPRRARRARIAMDDAQGRPGGRRRTCRCATR